MLFAGQDPVTVTFLVAGPSLTSNMEELPGLRGRLMTRSMEATMQGDTLQLPWHQYSHNTTLLYRQVQKIISVCRRCKSRFIDFHNIMDSIPGHQKPE